MTATLTTFFTKMPSKKSDCRNVQTVRCLGPDMNRPSDPAHEHGPTDQFHTERQDRATEEHGLPEFYLG